MSKVRVGKLVRRRVGGDVLDSLASCRPGARVATFTNARTIYHDFTCINIKQDAFYMNMIEDCNDGAVNVKRTFRLI